MNKDKKTNHPEYNLEKGNFKFSKKRSELMKQEPWYDDFVECIKKLGKE